MARTIDVDGGAVPEGFGGFKLKGGGKKPPLMVMVAGILFCMVLLIGGLMGLTGNLGVTNLATDQVGVKVNYMTGNREVVTTPGYVLYLPFLQEFFVLDKRTQDFIMEGNRYQDDNHVPALTVRASDGSNFSINDLQIQYELIPGAANEILDDSGVADGYKEDWIKALARSVLRDEFGRLTAVQAADPTAYKQAPVDARDRLNDLLLPHGLTVTLIKTPNPRFDADYEEAIENRKEADQEVQRLMAQVEQLNQEKAQRLASVEREKSVEMQQLEGQLVGELRRAEADAIEIKFSADEFAIKKRAEGLGNQKELIAQARGLEAKYRKEAEGIESRALALEERGEVVVREALIKKLLGIRFTLVPYSKDPAPSRLEHSGTLPLINEGGY
jgi:hypothetical protein